eukprot:g3293.t1
MWALLDKKEVPVIYSLSEKVAIQAGTTMYYWALVCGQVGAAFAATTTSMSLVPELRWALYVGRSFRLSPCRQHMPFPTIG